VGSSVLARALARARARGGPTSSLAGAVAGDVATVPLPADPTTTDADPTTAPPHEMILQSVDFFPAPVADPYVLGRVVAVHALSDLHAAGARPLSALAMATLTLASARLMEEDLFQLLCGMDSVLGPEGCRLAGGHTTEGPETVAGLAVTGVAPLVVGEDGVRHRVAMRGKGPLAPGDGLVLSKALGTGALLAAGERGLVPARHIAGAWEQMQRSNGPASAVAAARGATACTDVTGFGLAGHLGEMLAESPGCSVRLMACDLPVLRGAADLGARGARGALGGEAGGALSSLHADNAALVARLLVAPGPDLETVAAAWPSWPLLADPQTSGGLLIAVPGGRAAAEALAADLRAGGDARAAVVGDVVPGDGGIELILEWRVP